MHILIDSPIILMETVPSFLMWPQVSRWPVTTNQHKASNFFKLKFSFIQSPLFLFLIFFQFPQLQWIMQNVTVPRFPCILASFGKAGKKNLLCERISYGIHVQLQLAWIIHWSIGFLSRISDTLRVVSPFTFRWSWWACGFPPGVSSCLRLNIPQLLVAFP